MMLGDLRWALNVMRVRRLRRRLGFSARLVFDAALRPPVSNGVIAYPDALYHVTIDDIVRAIDAVEHYVPSRHRRDPLASPPC